MKPQVSVIIPIYNAEKYLIECLESVVKQTIFEQIEVVAVNDGSTDKSASILANYASKYGNIHIITESNRGIALARQEGLKHTEGGYIAYLDDDDFVNPNMYEVLLKAAEQNGADYVYCNYSFYPKAVTTKAKWFKPYKGKLDWNLIERNTQPWNKLIRRDLAERIHMADLLPEYSDSVYVDLLIHAKKIVCVDQELYNYRVGHASVSGSYKGKLNYYQTVSKRAREQIHFLNDIPNRKDLEEYFEYRYIYTLIQVCCVAAVNDSKKDYQEAVRELKSLKYKSNSYTNKVLNVDYGKTKAYVLIHVIPANYEVARKICKRVFSG